jgi:stress-induced morphogen
MPNESVIPDYHQLKTRETNKIERLLREEFPDTEAYRHNSASIRVRIVDPRFEGKSDEEREEMVMPLVSTLPKKTLADILLLLLLAPNELTRPNSHSLANLEFEHPLRSNL